MLLNMMLDALIMRPYTILILLLFVMGCGHPTPERHHPESPLTDDGYLVSSRDLVISGINVFANPENTHERMSNVFLVVKPTQPTRTQDMVFHGKFIADQRIEWAPVRSSRPPEYLFTGAWNLTADGTLTVLGHHEPTGDTPLLPELEGSVAFVVPTILLRRGYPPYSHTVVLWLKESKGKTSNKPDAGDGK